MDSPDAPCPLCGGNDSCGHILGACRHPDMHKQYIIRHNKAVEKITSLLRKGKNGGCYIVADIGTLENPDPNSDDTRLPTWVLPNTPAEERSKMRPDILIIPTLSREQARSIAAVGSKRRRALDRGQHTVHIVEVGYGPDTNHASKIQEKTAQHQTLAQALEDRLESPVYQRTRREPGTHGNRAQEP